MHRQRTMLHLIPKVSSIYVYSRVRCTWCVCLYVCMAVVLTPHLLCRSVPCRLGGTGSFLCSIHDHLHNRGAHPCAVHPLIHQHPVQPVTAASAVCCGCPTKHWLQGCRLLPPNRLPSVCRAGCASTATGHWWHCQPTTRHRGGVYNCIPFPRPGRASLATERTPVTSIF